MNKAKSPYRFAFTAVILAYVLVLARFGMENFDTGYIASYSWRILNGETPYVDFFYKGPPVTMYFHAFWMWILPQTGQFYFMRVVFYLLFGFQVYLAVSGFYRLFPGLKSDRWWIMAGCFVISLLNFSPYPWPTTDGLLFASAAFSLLSFQPVRPGVRRLAAIALLCLLSALTKQSFYGVPLLFALWIFLSAGWRKGLVFLGLGFLFLSGFLLWVHNLAGIGNYLRQTTGETHLYQLFFTGLHNYMPVPVRILLPTGALLLILFASGLRYRKERLARLWPGTVKWLSMLSLSAIFVLFLTGYAAASTRLAFDLAALLLLLRLAFEGGWRTHFPKLVLLGIAWSCSISLGYQYPVLFATGIILVVLPEFETFLPQRLPRTLWPVLLATAFAYALYPYREQPIWRLDAPLSGVSPKFAGLYTTPENARKFLELRQLRDRYGKRYVVAPNLPIAHYLFGDRSVVPSDWLLPTEIGRRPEVFMEKIPEDGNVVFLEKSYLHNTDGYDGTAETFSPVSWYLHQHMVQIGETRHFIIYQGLK